MLIEGNNEQRRSSIGMQSEISERSLKRLIVPILLCTEGGMMQYALMVIVIVVQCTSRMMGISILHHK